MSVTFSKTEFTVINSNADSYGPTMLGSRDDITDIIKSLTERNCQRVVTFKTYLDKDTVLSELSKFSNLNVVDAYTTVTVYEDQE